MTESPKGERIRHRRVLLAHELDPGQRRWYEDLDAAFAPAGLVACRAFTGIEAVRHVERGGLAGAVLFAGDHSTDGLSLLRIIRSIDTVLPCWLVVHGVSRWALQEALALRAVGVLTQPVAVNELAWTLRKRLLGPMDVNGN